MLRSDAAPTARLLLSPIHGAHLALGVLDQTNSVIRTLLTWLQSSRVAIWLDHDSKPGGAASRHYLEGVNTDECPPSCEEAKTKKAQKDWIEVGG